MEEYKVIRLIFRSLTLAAAALGAFLPIVVSVEAQTAVDLKTQAKRVDFASALSTRPMKTGSSLPASCDTGEAFVRTDVAAGGNLYICTAADTWSVQGSGSGAEPPASEHGNFRGWDSTEAQSEWFSFGNLLSISGRSVNVATESVPQYLIGAAVPDSCAQWGVLFFEIDATGW